MDMAEYILSILRTQLMVVCSWGFRNPVAIENGLEFRVNGFKHKGKVRVQYIEGIDLFEVRILEKNGFIKQKEENVYLDCLVNVIDGLVEHTSDYKERVENEYGLNCQ